VEADCAPVSDSRVAANSGSAVDRFGLPIYFPDTTLRTPEIVEFAVSPQVGPSKGMAPPIFQKLRGEIRRSDTRQRSSRRKSRHTAGASFPKRGRRQGEVGRSGTVCAHYSPIPRRHGIGRPLAATPPRW
jgi:hypothetical protein